MWIRSQLEIFLTQMFPKFPELTRLEIGTCNPKCEMLEQISKRCKKNIVKVEVKRRRKIQKGDLAPKEGGETPSRIPKF